MRHRVDPVGRVLLRSGELTEEALADVLDCQRRTLPFASLCYVLGHATEEALVRALSKQCGVPGVVLGRSVIRLDVLDGFSADQALRHAMLPVYEDDRRVFVAVEDPRRGREALREMEFVRGKAVVVHVALHIALARAIRTAYAARARRQSHWIGAEFAGDVPADGFMAVVSDVDALPATDEEAVAHDAVFGDITKEIRDEDLLEIIDAGDDLSTVEGMTPVDERAGMGRADTATPLSAVELTLGGRRDRIDLDEGDAVEYRAKRDGPARVLIVDDDFATRHLLVKVMQPAGYVTATASGGGEAVQLIKSDPPDLVVIDVMLPEIDGFQVCRAIKNSRRYGNIPVILMSAVIDSGRVTDDVLRRYGADAYFEKPLNTDRLLRKIEDLLGTRRKTAGRANTDDGFERALELYRAGKVDEAMELLRKGLSDDPLSAKHHFVLANLLQKKSLLYEAIDEYEATVDLKPDYFPALTRLAYLYYKKGFSAKAIETWRRSLPHCPDPALRENIEVFMRKLIANMQSEDR
ncbi:MAG: response regulator [Deltaproteobacteria bacterium]|nr:MAG: response regulator [Deltaproteobacteria bacterium]